MGRWVSTPLVADTISANTWTLNFAASEQNQGANGSEFPVLGTNQVLWVNCYVWRPSTSSKVGTILDGNTAAVYDEPSAAVTEKVMHGTFSGSAVSVQNSDVLILEIWTARTIDPSTNDDINIYFDGTTVNTTENATVSNHAAFLETPQTLAFTITKLYFHAAASSVTGTLPSTEQSTLTAAVNGDAQTVNRSMNTTIGTSQTSRTVTTLAQTASQNLYFTKFLSEGMSNTSLAAGLYTYNFAAAEPNLGANFPVTSNSKAVYINCYVWRPSNGTKVATVLDGNSALVYNEPTVINTETVMHGTFTGAAVGSITSGDVLVFEVWFQPIQGAATARINTFYYDGTTQNTSQGTTVSNHASFLELPDLLLFGGAEITRALPTEIIPLTESGTVTRNKSRTRAETITVTG